LSAHVTACYPVIALSSQLKQLFEVLHLTLKLLDEGIILRVDFIATDALDDGFGSIGKFQGGDGFLN
jgi:hypothetical protein